MDYQELKQLSNSHVCLQCGKRLILVCDNTTNTWSVVCGTDKTHEGFKPQEPPKTEVRRGNADKLLGKGAQESIEQSLVKHDFAMSYLPRADIGSDRALNVNDLNTLVKWGEKIGLKPYLGHVCIYYGSPYVTIDGYYYILHRRSPGVMVGTRPLNDQERALYRVGSDDYAWIAEAWLLTTKIPTTGLGIVTRYDMDAKSDNRPEQFRAPIERAHPQRMAEKRAEWQLLRKIVPLDEPAPADPGQGVKP